jgi:hypothetical protein
MESRGGEGIVLYPVPIDRIAEVQALLAAPSGTWYRAIQGRHRRRDRGARSAGLDPTGFVPRRLAGPWRAPLLLTTPPGMAACAARLEERAEVAVV